MNTGNGSERTGGARLRMMCHSTVRSKHFININFFLLNAYNFQFYWNLNLFAYVGNDVTLFESQQLDECNNNVPDDDDDEDVVVVVPSVQNSKTSSNSSSPSPSLRSSPSSSPLSPSCTSSTSSCSDAVSHTHTHRDLKLLFYVYHLKLCE